MVNRNGKSRTKTDFSGVVPIVWRPLRGWCDVTLLQVHLIPLTSVALHAPSSAARSRSPRRLDGYERVKDESSIHTTGDCRVHDSEV